MQREVPLGSRLVSLVPLAVHDLPGVTLILTVGNPRQPGELFRGQMLLADLMCFSEFMFLEV